MLIINRGEVNSLVVTLTENSTATNPYYLWEFENQTSLVKYYMISTDTSLYKERYNRFSLTERSNPNTLIGEIELPLEGFYNYVAYQTSLPNLSSITTASQAVSYIVKSVEYGKLYVNPENEISTEYTGVDSSLVVYEPNGLLELENGFLITQEDSALIELQ